MDPLGPIPPPSTAAVHSVTELYNNLKTQSPDLARDFDQKYDAWKTTWFNGNHSPNANTRATGPEFNALAALGPKIIPFVVHRLTNEHDFMAIVLYNKVEADIAFKVDPNDILNSKVLQRHANLISMQWYASKIIEINSDRNLEMQNALKAWAELRVERQNYSSSYQFTDGEGYWALVDMGPSIVAPIMLEYYDDKDGWWHELLHELIHGEVSNAGIFFKNILFEEWKEWFDHKDYKDAPRGPDRKARRGHGYFEDDFQ